MKPVLILLLLLVCVQCTVAQAFSPGDIVRLVERPQHIPAHPEPGADAVHLRFESGSLAEVVAQDAATRWVLVNGSPVSGTETRGWISRKYIARALPGGADAGELGWTFPMGSPQPRVPGRLRIATWNLGNLHAVDGQRTFTGARPSVQRAAIDYERVRMYIRMLDADIVAVQEVDGAEALRRVVDADVYEVHVSSRPKPGHMNGRQNTGFAYRRGLVVTPQPDFTHLDVTGDHRLRYGARLDVTVNGKTIKLMSVHLKTGCFDASAAKSNDCQQFMAQVPILESWMDAAALAPEPFIVLGDFNRRFNRPHDPVWADLDDKQPPNCDLTTVTANMPICCGNNEFTEFIDHIVLDKRAAAWVDFSSFRHLTFRQQDRPFWERISDHCPIVVELWVP